MHIESQNDREVVKSYFKQALNVNREIEESKMELKDIIDVLHEKFEIPKPVARKVLKAMEKGNMPELRHKNEQFEDLYQAVIR